MFPSRFEPGRAIPARDLVLSRAAHRVPPGLKSRDAGCESGEILADKRNQDHRRPTVWPCKKKASISSPTKREHGFFIMPACKGFLNAVGAMYHSQWTSRH